MSLPLAAANRETGASMRNALPFSNKAIYATPDSAKQSAEDIRSAIEHAARARLKGGGRTIMGGIGVGPTGAPQMPMITTPALLAASQDKKSNRNASAPVESDDGGDLFAQLRPPRRLVGDKTDFRAAPSVGSSSSSSGSSSGNGGSSGNKNSVGSLKLLLIYNSASQTSMHLMDQLVNRAAGKPHPKLFEWCVDAVNSRQPDSAESARIIEKLSTLPQFRRELDSACVLFDRAEKMAYQVPEAIVAVIEKYKDDLIAALVEQKLNSLENQSQYGGGGGGGGGVATAADVRRTPGGRQLSTVPEKAGGIPRRSVLRGKSMEELQRIAEEEELKAGKSGRGGAGGSRKQPSINTFDPSSLGGEDGGEGASFAQTG